MTRTVGLSTMLLAVLLTVVAAGAAPITTRGLLAELDDLGALPLLVDADGWQDSSYDRSGGNADAGHFLEVGDGDLKVLADVNGPGSIARIWSANPGGWLRIYFDDEAEPRVDCDFQAFFKDRVPPFAGPLTSISSGGWYSYLPMPFAKRCRITVQGGGGFYYQVSYQKYPTGTPVATFDPNVGGTARAALDRTQARWREPASPPVRPAATFGRDALGQVVRRERNTMEVAVPRRQRVAIWKDSGAGCIRALRMTITGADPQVLRRAILRCYWDDEWAASVEAPVADFFGCGFGGVKYASLPLGNTDEGYYCYWPMPYAKSARLDIENRSAAAIQVRFTVEYDRLAALAPSVGQFHAQWRQALTETGVPYRLLRAAGRGKFCGVNMTMKGDRGIHFLEGDELIFVDGQKRYNGTGTEDYFNCGWYFNAGTVHKPLHGLTVKDEAASEIAAYRWQIPDFVNFEREIVVDIEHAGISDYPGALYASVAYWYQAEPHEKFYKIPAAMAFGYPRYALHLPRHAVGAAGALARDGRTVRRVTWDHLGSYHFGPDLVPLPRVGSRATFVVDVPAGDRYHVVAYGAGGRSFGKVALVDEPGEAGDFYRPAEAGPAEAVLGTLGLGPGERRIALRVVGKNPEADGAAVAIWAIGLHSASPLVKKWRVLGPFPNPDGVGRDTVYPPERDGVNLDAEYEARGKRLRWMPAEAGADGVLDLRAAVVVEENVVGYAATYVESPTARETEMLMGSDDGVKVWLNGTLVHDKPDLRRMVVDQDRFPVRLKQGLNTILVKVDQGPGDWKMSLRVRDMPGDLSFDANGRF